MPNSPSPRKGLRQKSPSKRACDVVLTTPSKNESSSQARKTPSSLSARKRLPRISGNTPTKEEKVQETPRNRRLPKDEDHEIKPKTSTISSSHHQSHSSNASSSEFTKQIQVVQALLSAMPNPAPQYSVIRPIGQGTFSTVYLAELNAGDRQDQGEKQKKRHQRIAIKKIVPTTSPERIYVELECLRLTAGKCNVIPVVFCHRIKFDVLLAMPYIPPQRFADVVREISYKEMVTLMRNLLIALAHIHSFGIIHRDVKPANFLFDFKTNRFGLIDFGLAQFTGKMRSEPAPPTSSKRKLSSGDLESSFSKESPSTKRSRLMPLSEANMSKIGMICAKQTPAKAQKTPPKTPPRDQHGGYPNSEHYDNRMALIRTPSTSKVDQYYGRCETEVKNTPDSNKAVTPRKNKVLHNLTQEQTLRRSPRKHESSRKPKCFSKLTISGNNIVGASTARSIKKTPSFTMLDPTSGIPSGDCYTPQLNASVTSRCPSLTNSSSGSSSRFHPPVLYNNSRCDCFGKGMICSKCTSRKPQKAPRAGTPGFRPPEVLLKFEHQTTAVDIWAAGIILLCMMSRTYPFFRAPDDMTALAELICIFGNKEMEEVACQYGKRLTCSEKREKVFKPDFTQRLAYREGHKAGVDNLTTSEAFDLLTLLLKPSSHERITAQEALSHPFFHNAN